MDVTPADLTVFSGSFAAREVSGGRMFLSSNGTTVSASLPGLCAHAMRNTIP